jgi:ATP-dependent DNA helicase RecG
MAQSFSQVERMLANEQKNHADHVIIGGVEKFINTWINRIKADGETQKLARAELLARTLQGYGEAELVARKDMLARAIAAFQDQADEPSEPEPSDDIIDDFDDDDEDELPIRQSNAPKTKPRARPAIQANYGLDASVSRLQGVGPNHAKKLEKLGIYVVNDLLYHYPRRYDDYSKLKTISQLMKGDEVTILAAVSEVFTRDTRRTGLTVTNVVLSDTTGLITATFFNQPYLQQQFKAGRRIVVSGKVDQASNRMLSFQSPTWEPMGKSLLHTARVVPIYPLTEGISSRWLRRLVNDVVEFWASKVPDPMPETIRTHKNLLDIETALREIHFPTSFEKMEQARHRLILDEFLAIQIGVLQQRHRWRQQPGKALRVDQARADLFLSQLPFQLTQSQRRVLGQILGDIQLAQPMSRLLQGDVGSGKTIVAAIAMLMTVANGSQAALMAPTEILAEQHYNTLTKVFANLPNPPRIERLIGNMKNREKEEVRRKITAGEVDIVVGTHALLQEDVEFRDLAFAVIDEQHRFGVEQRGIMRGKGYNPHLLVMSATPIPRTLALTIYGDLDLSVIDEMPPGRQPVNTKWLQSNGRERAYDHIRKQVAQGHQAFVICPLIEESEAIDAKAAVEHYNYLSTQVFPDLRVGLIHGKLRPSEKDETMNAFREHQLDILVATSVIEVGIDVPNATIMVIEGADRFGLAQLHQFRGRVGRGAHESFCILMAEKKETISDERMRIIQSTHNGFLLAEEDLKLRGPGEFFGLRQSGLPDLKIAKLSDTRVLEEARQIAQGIFDRDPELREPEHQALAQRVRDYWKGKGDLS